MKTLTKAVITVVAVLVIGAVAFQYYREVNIGHGFCKDAYPSDGKAWMQSNNKGVARATCCRQNLTESVKECHTMRYEPWEQNGTITFPDPQQKWDGIILVGREPNGTD